MKASYQVISRQTLLVHNIPAWTLYFTECDCFTSFSKPLWSRKIDIVENYSSMIIATEAAAFFFILLCSNV